MYKTYLKNILDFFIASISFLILLPIFTLTLLFLLLSNLENPFFLQKRPGKNERIFTIIKFKTMNDQRYENGELLPDSLRLTHIGKFIRSTSLDEIPQLINVIKGDMSMVGPRPLLCEYLPLYNDFQKQRHDVKPGITGWAQVNGRNAISWDEKFKFDIYYVNNINFILDIKIILKTITKVIQKEGINEKNSKMIRFQGNKR